MSDYAVRVTVNSPRDEASLDALVDALADHDPVGHFDDLGYPEVVVTLTAPSAALAVAGVEREIRSEFDGAFEIRIASTRYLDEVEPEGMREMTVPEACRALGLTKQRVHQMIASGVLDVRRVGRDLLVSARSVKECSTPTASAG